MDRQLFYSYGIKEQPAVVQLIILLTLKAPNKNCSRRHFFFTLLKKIRLDALCESSRSSLGHDWLGCLSGHLQTNSEIIITWSLRRPMSAPGKDSCPMELTPLLQDVANRPRGYKKFHAQLSWAWNYEILNADKYEKISRNSAFSGSDKMLFFLLINVKMPIIVGILAFLSRKNSMLSWIDHGKSFITSGPGCGVTWLRQGCAIPVL